MSNSNGHTPPSHWLDETARSPQIIAALKAKEDDEVEPGLLDLLNNHTTGRRRYQAAAG